VQLSQMQLTEESGSNGTLAGLRHKKKIQGDFEAEFAAADDLESGQASHCSLHFMAMQSWAGLRSTLKSSYEAFRLQTSVASQSNCTVSSQPWPFIHLAVAHLQMHQVGSSLGQRFWLPFGPP